MQNDTEYLMIMRATFFLSTCVNLYQIIVVFICFVNLNYFDMAKNMHMLTRKTLCNKPHNICHLYLGSLNERKLAATYLICLNRNNITRKYHANNLLPMITLSTSYVSLKLYLQHNIFPPIVQGGLSEL